MHTLHSLLCHFSCAAGFKKPRPTWSSTFTSTGCTHEQLWPRSTGIYNRLSPSRLQPEQNTSAAWADESSKILLIVLSCRVLEGNARRIRKHLRATLLKPWECLQCLSVITEYIWDVVTSISLGHIFLCRTSAEEWKISLLASISTAKCRVLTCPVSSKLRS